MRLSWAMGRERSGQAGSWGGGGGGRIMSGNHIPAYHRRRPRSCDSVVTRWYAYHRTLLHELQAVIHTYTRYIRYACNGGSSARSVPSIVTKRYPCWTEFISKSARHLGETLVSEGIDAKKWISFRYSCVHTVGCILSYVLLLAYVCESIFKSWQILCIFQTEQKHIRVPQIVVKYIEATI